MTSALRKALLRGRIRWALSRAQPDSSVRALEPGRRHVFVALAADYGNLGDLAITRAQIDFLRSALPDAIVEEIPISRTLPAIQALKRVIGPDDIIALIGGGNTGDMYDDIQFLRELFISSFPEHHIVSFPQTIEFSTGFQGKLAGARARRAYNRHPRLAVVARDSRSLASARRMFDRCSVYLAPDVVLTLDRTEPAAVREGVVLSLRRDRERGLDDAAHQALLRALSAVGRVEMLDTHRGDVRFERADADAALASMWNAYRCATLVVTDRLHGMIFSVITGTPCVAFDSGTGKVAQFYGDWLHELPNVRLVQTVDEARIRENVAHVVEAGPSPAPRALRTLFEVSLEPVLASAIAR